MEQVKTSFMIKSDDLNHHGTLFAGKAMLYFVEAGFITVANTYKKPDEIVCVGVNFFKFFRSVKNGQILEFSGRVVHIGKTSLTVYVKGVSPLLGEENMEGFITYVSVDSKSREKKPHGLCLDDSDDEAELSLRRRALEVLGR